jgi:hypothetical protein
VNASEIANDVNQHIRELGARLEPAGGAAPLLFLCECGCLTGRVEPALVSLTIGEYDELDGAPLVADGHRRVLAVSR